MPDPVGHPHGGPPSPAAVVGRGGGIKGGKGVGLAHEREASDPYALGTAGCADADRGEHILNGPLPAAELAVQQVVPQFHRSGQTLLGRDFIRAREEGGDAFRDGHGAFPPGAWYAERSLISFSGEARRYTVRHPDAGAALAAVRLFHDRHDVAEVDFSVRAGGSVEAGVDVGAGTCAIAAYRQDLADELLGVDGREEFTAYLAPAGKV